MINYKVPINGDGVLDPIYRVHSSKDTSPKLVFDQHGVLDSTQTQELTAYALELINSVRVPLGLPALKMNSLTVQAGQAMSLDRAQTATDYAHVDAMKDIDNIIGQMGTGQNAAPFSTWVNVSDTAVGDGNNTMLFAKANLVNAIISMMWNDYTSAQGHAKNFLNSLDPTIYPSSTYMSLSIISPDLKQAAGGYNVAFNFYKDGTKINSFPDLPVNDTTAGVEDTVAIQLQNAVTKAKATNQEAITNLHNAENKLTQDQVILETANTNYNTANQMLTAAQKDLTSKQSVLQSAEKDLSTNQQALQQAQSSLKDNAAQLSNDQVTQSHAQAVVDNLDSALKEKIALLNSAETKLNNLTKVLNEAKNDYENKQAILKVANNKLSDAKANLANDLKNLATLQEKLSTLTNADSLLATAKSNLASAKSQFDQANAALESATSELATAQAKYNTIKMDYDAELAVQKELAIEAQKEAHKANKGQKSSVSLSYDSDAQPVTQNGTNQYVELSNMNTISPKIRPAAETTSQVQASSVFASSANSLLTRLPQTGEQNNNLWLSIISGLLSLAALFGIRKHHHAAHLRDASHV
ncbi:SEC10/PgrA surface exclusion domain-containing protein [Leuconostoc pseudomesenteroides]|uniref:SEC10/PgrA surface exclusion domain-containing protein n=1 Tax=Leuconostoc pseudomesenteroides TaxID=33968 RepID=UPI0016685B79|nr:SEC10/PgrA surface exclusion domain-containing protein [Leuconostoc pseudomesenteroides]